MKKRALSLVLAGLMCVGVFTPVAAETTENEKVTITMMLGNDQDRIGSSICTCRRKTWNSCRN